MRTPSKRKLHKKAHAYGRKRFRKDVRQIIRNMSKNVSEASNKGKFQVLGTVTEESKYSYEKMLAMRWYRRFSKLDVEITEVVDKSVGDYRYIEEMHFKISW